MVKKSKYQVMPDLTDEEYAELKADIAERGVQVPIEFDEDGNCIDGHHRLKICEELGITNYPSVHRDYKGDEAAKVAQARKLNMARRHLTPEQRREMIRDQIKETPERSDRQIAEDLDVGHATVSRQRKHMEEAGGVSQRDTSTDTLGREQPRHRKPVTIFNPTKRDEEAFKDPDIRRRMEENEGMTVAGARREQMRDRRVEYLEKIETKEAKAIEGVYDVITIDPPWPMEKIELNVRPNQTSELDYPIMLLEDIKALPIPAAEDCHVYLWTTQKFLPDAIDVLKSWGLKYVCTFVWHKTNGGYKPIDLPKYNCEFCLYARKGTPRFIDDHNFNTCIDAPITGHSEKPEEFYEMLRRVTAGRRLDMFNRRAIEGFDGWGMEVDNTEDNDPSPP